MGKRTTKRVASGYDAVRGQWVEVAGMNGMTGAELKELGRAAAAHVAGDDAVQQVEVSEGEDSSDRPVYYFSFLIDQARARQRPGLVLVRLIQKLLDDLIARGDSHYPSVRILDKDDWAKRANAKSV